MINQNAILSLNALLEEGIRHQIFESAEASWIVCPPHGTISSAVNVGITTGRLFDIASLTKLFTASVILRLVAQNALKLDDTLDRYISPQAAFPLGKASIEQVLRHQAGFAPWYPFFEAIPPTERGTPKARKTVIDRIISHPPNAAPGEKTLYSDLGYILLAYLIECVVHKPFPDIVSQEVLVPLNLNEMFLNTTDFTDQDPKQDIAPTEYCPWRGRRLQGEVHDDNAWTMGGIGGHAGLFATADGIAQFGAAWLMALQEDSHWLPRTIAREAVHPHPSHRGLGWDFKSPGKSSAGQLYSKDAFGHLGFTGCSIWVDPERRLSTALLTNRVYFGRENDRIRQFRPKFHDQLIRNLGM